MKCNNWEIRVYIVLYTDEFPIFWITVTIIKLLVTAIRDVIITSRRSWNCPLREHLVITPSFATYVRSNITIVPDVGMQPSTPTKNKKLAWKWFKKSFVAALVVSTPMTHFWCSLCFFVQWSILGRTNVLNCYTQNLSNLTF